MSPETVREIAKLLTDGAIVPYLGPAVPRLNEKNAALPASAFELAQHLGASVTLPSKVRANLTGAAQYIESFKHRKTLNAAVSEAFAKSAEPAGIHRLLFQELCVPLVLHAWYDDLPQRALAARTDWVMLQGISQAEHRGAWFHTFASNGAPASLEDAAATPTVLYQPLGSVTPARNYLVSDSDFVEMLTEIDIQTPIPEIVQRRRAGCGFLFLGCRFDNQIERQLARQISKRSSDRHWAVLADEPTRNEARFLAEFGIQRIAMQPADFEGKLREQLRALPDTTASVV